MITTRAPDGANNYCSGGLFTSQVFSIFNLHNVMYLKCSGLVVAFLHLAKAWVMNFWKSFSAPALNFSSGFSQRTSWSSGPSVALGVMFIEFSRPKVNR